MWVEITERKQEFRQILKLLVEFDERTGRHARYSDPETHCMRKAISAADPDRTRILLNHLGGFVYNVVAQVETSVGLAISAYVHEDGIKAERAAQAENHPIQKIVCMTDLYEDCKNLESREHLNPFTVNLLDQANSVTGRQ